MHLRYDPIAETIMSGNTSINDVPMRDVDYLRRHMREVCRQWDHQRFYRVRIPGKIAPARFFVAEAAVPPSAIVDMRFCDIELVRPPRQDRFPMPDGRRAAEEKAMRMMMAYNVGDAKAAMRLFNMPPQFMRTTVPGPVRMPPLDAPKPEPKGQGEKCQKLWDSDEFIERLKRRGYRTLGAGCFSTVLAKGNSKRVIKVNRRPDGWLDYVLWAAKHGHMGKNAPMVYSFRRFNEGTSDEFYVAVVERCKMTVDDLYPQNKRVTELFSSLTSGMRGRMGSERDALKADDMQPGSLRFAIEFKLTFTTHTDLHSGNFMVREDGSLVCTDPISGSSSGTAPSRWRASSARLAA